METGYFVCPARPRMVDGKPSANVRYLQDRPDLVDPFAAHVAAMGMRLRRRIPADGPVATAVGAVLMGRRNNPPDAAQGIRPLAVYNPLHYQELPEAFMDFIASLTGKIARPPPGPAARAPSPRPPSTPCPPPPISTPPWSPTSSPTCRSSPAPPATWARATASITT